jgi:hypothetical protein
MNLLSPSFSLFIEAASEPVILSEAKDLLFAVMVHPLTSRRPLWEEGKKRHEQP